MDKSLGFMKRGPDVRTAAKSGEPAMTPMRPAIPVSVPVAAPALGGTTDVTVQQVGNSTALDNNPDARQIQPAPGAAAATATNPDGTAAAPAAVSTPAAAPVANEPLPSNRQAPPPSKKKQKAPKAPKETKQN
jgi:hypothetical protein